MVFVQTILSFLLFYTSESLTNVEEIKCLDNNITALMESAVTEEESSRMQRFVTFYTGEMAGVVWQMVEPYQPKDLWQIAREIYVLGKPRFIDFKFNSERFVRLLHWQLDDITFFSDLRTDANSVWEQFVEIFLERKNKHHHTIDDTTIAHIEQVYL